MRVHVAHPFVSMASQTLDLDLLLGVLKDDVRPAAGIL